MMEETADETNGESTFEFVGGKDSTECSGEIPDPALPVPEQAISTAPSSVSSVISEEAPVSSKETSSTFQPPVQLTGMQSEAYPTYSSVTRPISSTLPPYSLTPSTSSLSGFTVVPQEPLITAPQQLLPSVSQPCRLDEPLVVSVPTDFQDSAEPHSPSGVWEWIKGNGFLNKVAEKAKNSVDSMITTLDPGMKEFLYSGGDIDIVVASDKEVKVSPVREAFQQTFGRATISEMPAQPSNMAPQPVGFAAGLKAAEDRIASLKQAGKIHVYQPVVAIESFVVELTPERWYDFNCLVLQDTSRGINLHTFSQATAIPHQIAVEMQDRTPADYPLRWSGFAITVGEVIGPALAVPHTEWHEAVSGVTRRELLLLASRSLATLYRTALNR